jgi:hypothetical protein
MVDVFKTNVEEAEQSRLLMAKLREHFPFSRVHFDLEDCDHILRVESSEVNAEAIISLLEKSGFSCEPLPD